MQCFEVLNSDSSSEQKVYQIVLNKTNQPVAESGSIIDKLIEPLKGEYLKLDTVLESFEKVLKKTVKIYVDSLNIIHYMHDKYAYEVTNKIIIESQTSNKWYKYFNAFGRFLLVLYKGLSML